MRARAESKPGVELNDHGPILLHGAVPRAYPKSLAKPHWPEVFQPFSFPGAIGETFYLVWGQIGEFKRGEQVVFEMREVCVRGEKTGNPGVFPKRRFSRTRFEHGVISGVAQRYRPGTVTIEDLFDGGGIQCVEVHDKLLPIHR